MRRVHNWCDSQYDLWVMGDGGYRRKITTSSPNVWIENIQITYSKLVPISLALFYNFCMFDLLFFPPIITLMYSHCDTCFDALLCMLISGNYIFFLFGISHYLFHQNVWVIITKSLFEPAIFTYFILLLTALILI